MFETSQVRILKHGSIFLYCTGIKGNRGGQNEGGQNRVAAYPLTVFIVVEILSGTHGH
jgi:hypothetical protein